jgi:hypothetical protein
MVTVCYEAAVRHTSWSRVAMIALQAAVIYVSQSQEFHCASFLMCTQPLVR